MKKYKSIEEFIFLNKRYPDPIESKLLYDTLWDEYINNLTDKEKEIAIKNDRMQDYKNGNVSDQREIVKKIAESVDKMKKGIENKKMIISVSYGERWGMYSIYVRVNCLRQKQLVMFRKSIPNFYEGFEIKILPTTVFMRLFNLFKKRLLFKIGLTDKYFSALI